jgi:hypothetical protein
MDNHHLDWIPASCTLPTAEQPFRVAEFEDLFTASVRAVDRDGPTTLRLTLDAAWQDQARELAARESNCCSFFGFEFIAGVPGTITMQITVPPAHTAILDAFANDVIARGN